MKRTNTYIYKRGRWQIVQKEKFEPCHYVISSFQLDGEEVDSFTSRFVAPKWHLDAYIDGKEGIV